MARSTTGRTSAMRWVAVAAAVIGVLVGPLASLAAPHTYASTTGDVAASWAMGQNGTADSPAMSRCNIYSAHWGVGSASVCAAGTRAQDWCADFAAMAWEQGGVAFRFGTDLTSGAVSFYRFGVARGTWHPVGSGYSPQPGDAVLFGTPSSPAHVGIYVSGPAAAPNVVSGNMTHAGAVRVFYWPGMTSNGGGAALSGYVSIPSAAVAAPAAPVAVTEGSFVSNGGNVYRIAGGAPVYVSTWDAFGGSQPTTALDDARFAALPTVPTDGTFIAGARRGEVYRVAGGAPVYVSTWDAFGGAQPVVAVDDAAIDHAGEAGVWAHLRAVPADGTFVSGARRGEVYRVAGGAPLYVSTWDAFGGAQPVVAVDDAAIDHAGEAGVWAHLRAVPADGTLIRGSSSLSSAIVYGGVARGTENQTAYTVVDQAAIQRAGTGGVWNHLLAAVGATTPSAPAASASPSPSASPSLPATPAPSASPTPGPQSSASVPVTARPAIRVRLRAHGRAVTRGWLCLTASRSTAVRQHHTAAGACSPVADRGPTTLRANRAGSYFLVLLSPQRTVSAKRVAVRADANHTITWRR